MSRGECYVDDDDKATVEKHIWRLGDLGYAVTYFPEQPLEMHRYIFPAPDSLKVNFINRNKLDYRRANMRHVGIADILRNTSTMDRKTYRNRGRKGFVRYVVSASRWEAYVDRCYLGRYADEETARAAIDAALWWWDKHQLPRGEELLKVYAERGKK